MKLKPIKVSVLNQFIKKSLMSNSILNNLRVEGEITNIKRSKSGYTYFTLCDETSGISCVIFDFDTISKNGDRVIVEGEISVYEAKGTYQINVKNIEQIGLGKILDDLEKLKKRLQIQGKFEKHIQLPVYPSKIGIITSKSGAAIKDILKTMESVKGNFEITVYNTLVQGNKAKQNILDGIKYFNDKKSDVILISRGGGSFEDLNIFNDIEIAEEVFKSTVPVVTGIGHETDRTLTDYTADEYCHTPTAAAERIIRGYRDIEDRLNQLYNNLKAKANNSLLLYLSEIKTAKYILKNYLPIENIYNKKNILDNYRNVIENNLDKRMSQIKYDLDLTSEKLKNYNYKNNLKKGFALVTDKDGTIINKIHQISKKDILDIWFNNFTVNVQTINIKED